MTLVLGEEPGVLTLVPDIFRELRTSLGSVTGLSELATVGEKDMGVCRAEEGSAVHQI